MYLPHRRDFFQDPPPLWKFQINLIHFFNFFGLREPPNPHPPGNSNPFCGGSMDIFWYCAIALFA